MKIIIASYIYKDKQFLENMAIAFKETIQEIAPKDKLLKKYPNAKVYEYNDCIIYPGFVNMHTHLEFSANKAKLKFGDFMLWLDSVIKYKEELVNTIINHQEVVFNATKEMLLSGVTTFGAISSFGLDLKACLQTPQRVIYFNEVIGSNPAMVDALFNDFKQRLQESLKYKSKTFFPAVAIHAPYSVHPILLKAVLTIAKEKNLPLSTHFLESQYEREWLENAQGAFRDFFEKYFNITTPLTSILEFLDAFKEQKTLFTHCVWAKEKEIDYINKYEHSVIHCPRSNRFLGCGKLNISNINNLLLGTDGLSSNNSLSILEEMQAALMMHYEKDLQTIALLLIDAVTNNVTKALNLPIGILKEGYFADFTLLSIPNTIKDKNDLALYSIISNKKAKALFINGQAIIV